MNYLLRIIKNTLFWTYARNTWQWDMLCVLILVFIFLTPKSCFEGSERHRGLAHQGQSVSTVILGPEVIVNEGDTGRIEQRVRALTGRANAQVVNVRRRQDRDGKTLGYEVDIR